MAEQTIADLSVSVGMDTQDMTQGADQAARDVEQSFGGIAAAAAGVAVAGLFIAGLSSALDISSANAALADQFELTKDEAARAGGVAGDVFSAGFGESVAEVTEAVGAVQQAMGGMSQLTDAQLDSMSTSALRLAQRLGVDVADAATMAGQMVKQKLVKDGEEAFDVLTVASRKLPKSMLADATTIVSEYGIHFAKIGLSAKDAFGMMSQYVQAGGKDIDQAGDVLHEFARITSEEGEKAEAAFKGLGLNGKAMLAEIHKGGEPAKAALQKTIEALRGVKDPGEQAALAVELFGDMAGEGASALWAMDPATAATATGMSDVQGAADEANKAMADSPAQQMEAAMRQLQMTLGEALLPVLTKVGKFMADHPGLIKVLVPVVLGLAVAIGVMTVAQWLWNAALWAWPGTWIIAGILAVIAVIVLIVVYWDQIKAVTIATWEAIVGALSAAWDWIKSAASATWSWLTSIVTTAWGWITSKTGAAADTVMGAVDKLAAIPGKVKGWFDQVVGFVAGMPGRIAAAGAGMWNSITSGFKSAVNGVIGGWNRLHFTVGGGSFMGVSIPSFTLHTPDIPYLANGGIVQASPGGTLAVIGEGGQDEAVIPLDRLQSMMPGVQQAVRSTGGGGTARVVIDVDGADENFKQLIRSMVRLDGGGDVQAAFGS